MDEREDPEPGHVLTFVRDLKAVFDICDVDSDGFIRPEELELRGAELGNADQVKSLTECFNPDAHGRITFTDFCRGVLTLKGYFGSLPQRTEFILETHQTEQPRYQPVGRVPLVSSDSWTLHRSVVGKKSSCVAIALVSEGGIPELSREARHNPASRHSLGGYRVVISDIGGTFQSLVLEYVENSAV